MVTQAIREQLIRPALAEEQRRRRTTPEHTAHAAGVVALFPAARGEGASGANQVSDGISIIKDQFEPEHERPNVDIWTLADLGYVNSDVLGWRPQRAW